MARVVGRRCGRARSIGVAVASVAVVGMGAALSAVTVDASVRAAGQELAQRAAALESVSLTGPTDVVVDLDRATLMGVRLDSRIDPISVVPEFFEALTRRIDMVLAVLASPPPVSIPAPPIPVGPIPAPVTEP